MVIKPNNTYNTNPIDFICTNWKVSGFILSYDIKHHTLMLNHDYNSQQSSPARKSEELYTITMISECVLEKRSTDYISNGIILNIDTHYMSNYELTQLHKHIDHKLSKKTKYIYIYIYIYKNKNKYIYIYTCIYVYIYIYIYIYIYTHICTSIYMYVYILPDDTIDLID